MRRTWMAVAVLAGASSAQEFVWGVHGGGRGLFAAGDVDRDGIGDLLANSSVVWYLSDFIQFTPPLGDTFEHVNLVSGGDGNRITRLDSPTSNEAFGHSAIGGADLDGDGRGEFLVGAPLAVGSVGEVGAVYIYDGATRTQVGRLEGSVPLQRFGWAVRFLPDIDGDRVADIAVGAPGSIDDDTVPGQVRFFSGASLRFRGALAAAPGQRGFGAALCLIDDRRLDGKPKLLIGAPHGGPGYARIHSLVQGRLLSTLSGSADGDRFGFAAADVGDIDRDGIADVVVGAPGGGYARAYRGAGESPLTAIDEALDGRYGDGAGSLQTTRYGWAISSAGDADADGHDDFVIGDPFRARIFVHSGRDGRILGVKAGRDFPEGPFDESSESGFGAALVSLGDVNGDAGPDFAVAAPIFGDDNSSPPIGRITVWSGGMNDRWLPTPADSAATLGDLDQDGKPEFALAGRQRLSVYSTAGGRLLFNRRMPAALGPIRALCGVGDWDGDGTGDLAIGLPEADPGGKVEILSGVDGEWIRELAGPVPDQRFGFALACLGDVSGDGRSDLVVGAPGKGDAVAFIRGHATCPTPGLGSVGTSLPAGAVRVYGGGTGALLREIADTYRNPCTNEHGLFGYSIVAMGDVSGDGAPDFAVGSPKFARLRRGSCCPSGAVTLHSGTSGAVLWANTFGDNGIQAYGFAIAGGAEADFDGDGIGDVVVSNQRSRTCTPCPASGSFQVLSGASGAYIMGFSRENDISYGEGVAFGFAIAAIGDFDGDGRSDLAIGDPARSVNELPGAGSVRIVSGRTGAEILDIRGSSDWDYYGYSFAALGDVTQDGFADLLVGAPANGPDGHSEDRNGLSYARLIYGRPGVVQQDCNQDGVDDRFRPDLFDTDFDRDLRPDRCQLLAVNRTRISISAGGAQKLMIRAGSAHARASYAVLATLSGTAPGFTRDGIHVPINPDALTRYAFTGGDWHEFDDFYGALDVHGTGVAKVVIPPGRLPFATIGTQIRFAAVLLGTSQRLVLASSSMPLELVP